MGTAVRSDGAPLVSSRRRYRWLLCLPFIWQVLMVPVVNDVAWRPFELPFPMFWQMLGVIFTSAVIGLVYAQDRRLERALGAAAVDEHRQG
jgi:hypothetical protein